LHAIHIVAWLAEHYGDAFSSATCHLLRSSTNDVYLIRSNDQRFVLKIYGFGWRFSSDLQWEIDLLQHVSAQGLPVATPIPGCNQECIQSIAIAAGHCSAVLFAYVPGEKPQPPFSLTLYEHFGQAIARLHALSDSFVAAQPCRALDTSVLIDEPMTLVAPLLMNSHERTWLRKLASLVKDRITTYAAAGLDWGPIHGDASLDNLHVIEDGSVILYDFDLGGPGWRSADLQGWAVNHAEYHCRWDAFHQGYARVRALPEIDRVAAPYLTIAWDFRALKIELERRIMAQGQAQVQAYVGRQLEMLRERSKQYGLAAEI
jgi:Ser/Thr protein kinase RdoA (MazF antagonist)